jgi:hypothetical protein
MRGLATSTITLACSQPIRREPPAQLHGHVHPSLRDRPGHTRLARQPPRRRQTELTITGIARVQFGQHHRLLGVEKGPAPLERGGPRHQVGIGEHRRIEGFVAARSEARPRLEHVFDTTDGLDRPQPPNWNF